MAVVEVTEENAEYLDQTHACQHREKFSRDKRGATERSEPASEGVRGSPIGNFQKPILQMVQSQLFLSYICEYNLPIL